ncbi:MAG: hypothetical protein U0S36_11835 [Candidatus Nanopelagicales bacterium]
MSPPRQQRPLFRVFDRDPDRHRPVDADYVQVKPVRLHRPGPWRSLLVVLLAAVTTWSALAAAVAVSGARGLLVKLVVLLVAMLPVGLLVWVTSRVLAVGVYVTDRTLRQTRVLSLVDVDWSDIADVRRVHGRVPLLGVGPGVDGERVVVVLRDGSDLATTVTTASPDMLGRPEAYDQAALAVERWWSESRGAAS